MENLANYTFLAALITLVPAAALMLAYGSARVVAIRRNVVTAATAGAPGGGGRTATMTASTSEQPMPHRLFLSMGKYGHLLAWVSLAFLALWVPIRWVAASNAPWSNQYEFATVFSMGMLAAGLTMVMWTRVRLLNAVVVPAAAGMLLYANSLPSEITPLVPALQSPLLKFHVASAIVAYGFFTAAFGAAILYLLNERGMRSWLPSPDASEDIAYRSVIIGLPAQAVLLILGAWWGSIAWGRWWGWDPKETAALVTFLIYAAYMHSRVLHSWRGRRSAFLLILGFGAVLFTFFGNTFLGGLHSYSGL